MVLRPKKTTSLDNQSVLILSLFTASRVLGLGGCCDVLGGMPRPRAFAEGSTSTLTLQQLLSSNAPAELARRELAPDSPGLIVAIDAFLSADECVELMSAAVALGLQPARPDDLRPKKNEAFLNRESLLIVDEQLAARIWSRLLPHVPQLDGREPVGLHGDSDGAPATFKFYRYRRGHRFGPHVDTAHKGPGAGEETEFNFLIYLNSAGEWSGEPMETGGGGGGLASQPLAGGDTVFKRTVKAELARVSPRQGLGLLHAHGRRCCMHEAEAVSHGAKYVLRIDVLYRLSQQKPEPATGSAASSASASQSDGSGGWARTGGRRKVAQLGAPV